MIQSKLSTWELVVGITFAVFFVIALLAISLYIPSPTLFQYGVFRIILALSAAGIAGVMSGFLAMDGTYKKTIIRIGGALSVFVLIFFFNPVGTEFDISTPTLYTLSVLALFVSVIPLLGKILLSNLHLKARSQKIEIKIGSSELKIEGDLSEEQIKQLIDAISDKANTDDGPNGIMTDSKGQESEK